MSRIHDSFQIQIPLRSLFEKQTIADLAIAVVEHLAEDTDQDEMERILAELEEMELAINN
jgi:hypothetical protein